MKAKLVSFYDSKHPQGTEIEIDKILYDEHFAGHYKVRVVSGLPKDTYISINWIVKLPQDAK